MSLESSCRRNMGSLSALAVEYIDRVVNQRDLAAVDELVAPDYRGSGPGWPTTRDELRVFYQAQMRERPDWRIDPREIIELGDTVVVHAHAHGTVIAGDNRHPAATDWLAVYRFVDGRITAISILCVVPSTTR